MSNGKNAGDPSTVLTNDSVKWHRLGRARIPRVGAESSRGIVQQKERIIVVEPNDLILGLLERWLGEAGYTVVVETLQRLAQAVGEGGKPHLVIIDVPTPRSAETFIKSVREVHASPILLLSARFSTGYRLLHLRGAPVWSAQGAAEAVHPRRVAVGGRRVDRRPVSGCRTMRFAVH